MIVLLSENESKIPLLFKFPNFNSFYLQDFQNRYILRDNSISKTLLWPN